MVLHPLPSLTHERWIACAFSAALVAVGIGSSESRRIYMSYVSRKHCKCTKHVYLFLALGKATSNFSGLCYHQIATLRQSCNL